MIVAERRNAEWAASWKSGSPEPRAWEPERRSCRGARAIPARAEQSRAPRPGSSTPGVKLKAAEGGTGTRTCTLVVTAASSTPGAEAQQWQEDEG